MRYVLILLVTFSLNASIVTLPAQAGRLEIRSMPIVRNNPARRLLQKATYNSRQPAYAFGIGLVSWPLIILGAGALGGPEAVLNVGIPWLFVSGALAIWSINKSYNIEDIHHELKGRQVYYTELRDGKATLRFGKIGWFDRDEGMLAVETTHGTVAIDKHKKIYPDSKGISVPDHPDLHKRVSLLTDADSNLDYLYVIGQVSRVYDDGHYEIEIDNKIDYNNVESPIDKPFTVFVHASLPEHDGGFVFIDDEVTASENIDSEIVNAQIATAARQADSTQTDTDLGKSVEMWNTTRIRPPR